MHTTKLIVVGLCLISLGFFSVRAGVPNIVNYQGTIKDSDGVLLSGTHDLVFGIYASESGGEALWAESHFGVAFENGVFSVDLGEGTAFPPDLFDQPDRWIGMTVDNDVEMSPRMRFTSNPFSMRASVADTALSNGSGGDGHSLDAADGDPVDALFVDNYGNVLIGAPGDSLSEKGPTVDGKLVAINAFTGGELATADYGVYGWTGLYGGLAGVKGKNSNGNWGQLGGENGGAFGQHSNGNWGRLGGEVSGAYGIHSNGNYGRLGDEDGGALGTNSNGNYGRLGGENFGTYGYTSTGLAGVHGANANGNWGRLGGADYAIYGDGDCYFNNGTTRVDCIQIDGGCDFSERFDIGEFAGIPSPSPGMVVSIDPENPGNLTVCRTAYDRKVAGVISGAGGVKPGMLMGQTGSIADGEHPVALSGRVYVMADASFGSIQPGDLLTSSNTPGHAMKATDPDRSHGSIIGKAMTPQDAGRGLVLVLVNLQ